MLALKEAVNLTTQTIDRRAFHYRNLVVLLIALVGACAVTALVAGSALPLLGLFILVPLCGGYLVLDTHQVNRWRRRIMALWADEDLHLDKFTKAVISLTMLPPNT